MAGAKGKPRKRIMRKLRIDELSSVDRPAQVGARALLMKRDGEPGAPPTRKYGDTPAVMTSAEDGHSHLVYLSGRAGETSWQKSEDSESGHTHPWILEGDGSIVLGESDGHTHVVDQDQVIAALVAMKSAAPITLPKEDRSMPTPTQKSDAEKALEAQNQELQRKLARAEAVAALPVAEREHFEKLDASGQDAFMKLDASGRASAVAAAAEANAVVYTASDGTVFRKSDDPRLVAMAKRVDDEARKTASAEARAKDAEYSKRAVEELAHIPGTVAVRAAMLKAVDAIPDEAERKAALEALHAQNAEIGKAFDSLGVTGVTARSADPGTAGASGSEAERKLDEMAKQLQAAKPGLSFEKAYQQVLESPEGSKLYTKVFESQPRAQVN